MKLILLLFFPISILAQSIDNSGSSKAMDFINSLSKVQKEKTVLPFDEKNRYEWHFLPASMVLRDGISITELDNNQKQKLYTLMSVYLSEEGYTRTLNIIGFENLLRELQPGNSSRVPENYFVAIYGKPDKNNIWGWKCSGHHLALNFTIVEDKLAFAPFFFGAQPAEVKEGPKKGMRIIKDEEDLGFELVNSLTQEQKQKAIFRLKAFSDIVTGNAVNVTPPEPAGISAKDLTYNQKTVLYKLIVAYLLSMSPAIAETRMEKITREDMHSIFFGWAGETEYGKPHYFRVQGKSFLIEFDNTQNNANHIHTVWRDFNGDYGKDLLREHHLSSHR